MLGRKWKFISHATNANSKKYSESSSNSRNRKEKKNMPNSSLIKKKHTHTHTPQPDAGLRMVSFVLKRKSSLPQSKVPQTRFWWVALFCFAMCFWVLSFPFFCACFVSYYVSFLSPQPSSVLAWKLGDHSTFNTGPNSCFVAVLQTLPSGCREQRKKGSMDSPLRAITTKKKRVR